MPIFNYNGEEYEVAEKDIQSFAKEYPDAITKIDINDTRYRIKPADYDKFLIKFNIGGRGQSVPQPHQSVQQQPEQSVSQPQQTEAEANGEEKPQTESTLTKAMHQFQREQTQIPFEQTPVQEQMLNNLTKARAAQGIDPATGMLNGVSRIIKEQPGYIEPFEGKYDENAEDFDYGKLMSNMNNNYARSNNAVNKKAWADNEYDKMMREFEKSDRYNEIVSKYRNEYNSGKMTLDDATKQMNEDLSIEFNLTYENELDEIAQSIQQDMFDYNKAYFEHHKNRLDKRQTATDTDNMIATYEKEREKLVENSEYTNPVVLDLPGFNYKQTATERKVSQDEKNYNQAIKILNKSKKMQEAAKNQSGLWKGLADTATDVDIWTLGLSELSNDKNLMSILDKVENDKELTPAEQAVLDASLNQTLTTAFYANDLRGWYKAGQTTAMSIPFMLEVAATSMLGGGAIPALGKCIFKASMKNAGKSAYRKVLAKAASGATTSLAETGMQTAMFGGGHIAAGTKQRMIGDLKGYYDLEGNATYAGRENMQSFREALWNSTADYVSENLVERTGGMLKIGGHFAGPLSSKVASKFANTKIGKIYNEVVNNPFAKATHIGGYLEEFDEEVATMLLKPLLSTDSTVKDEMTLQNMKDTALGLLPTQIGFGLLGAGNYGVNSIKKANAIKANINAFNNMLTESEQQIFSEYRKLFNGKKAKLAGEEGRELFGQLIDEINNSDANDVEKVAKIAKLMQLTRDMQLPYEAMPETEEELTAQINAANGYAITDTQEMNDAQNMYEMQRKKMIDAGFAEEDLDSYDDSQLILYAKNMSESGVNPQTAQTIIDYINAKQTYDGMTQRVRDDIDTEVEASNAEIASHVNKDTGRIQTATLKEDDRQVYIISGEVKTFDDGTGVDTATSDHSIVVQDAATGKMEFVSLDAILNVGEEQDPTTLQIQARQEIEERRAQTAVDAMNGTVTQFNEDDKYTVTIEQEGKEPQQVEVEIVPNEQGIIDNGDGTVNVKDTDGQIVPLPKETIQKAVDEANMARAIEFETQKTEERLAAQQPQQPTRPEYSRNAQIKLRDDNGNEVRATIDDVNDDGFVVHLEDAATGRWRAVEMSRDELDERITEYEGQRIEEKKGDTLQTAASKPHGGISLYRDIIANVLEVEKPLSEGKGTNNSSEKQYPRDKKGNLILHEMETSDAVDEIEGIGNDALAAKLVENNLNKARKELDGLKKKTDNVTTAEEMKALSAQINDAETKVRAWEKINNERSRRASERNAQNMPSVQQELQAAQGKRQAEREQAMHEQQEAGFHVAGAQAKAKFANAPKVEGNTATRTLPNGEKITGRYVLTTPDALTPSHDPLNNFSKSDGFPLNENGTTVNDRDYQADQSAQNHTRLIAQQYDGQAVEQVPVVTQDGIVLDGNGRTMAGQLAAQNGTDAQYTQALSENAQNFGFTPEQVQSIPHARVVFVADQAMPYTTETLAKFNVNEKKTQSNTETAIANAKKLSVDTITKIADIIDEYATIDSFFASENAMAELFTLLQNEGVIGTNEIAGLFEGNTLNARGREYVTNLLIGSMFTEETIRSLAGNNDLKRTLVRATKQILANAKLGDYSLFDEINRAIALKHEADMLGSSVKLHLGQQNMFEEAASERYTEFEQMLAIALETGVEEFRTILDDYNREASPLAGGQLNIFTGEVTPKSEVIKTITEYYADRIKSKGKSATEQQPTDRAGHQADAAAQGVETRSRKGAERDGAVVAPDRGGETTGRGISEVGGQGTQGSVLQGTPTEDIRHVQTEGVVGRSLSEEESERLVAEMEQSAEKAEPVQLTADNWIEQFGEDGIIETPIGKVKMGANQLGKPVLKKRTEEFGMIKPTLSNPDAIIEKKAPADNAERETKYLFIKTFIKADGSRYVHYESVTVLKNGMDVSISSHEVDRPVIKKEMQNGIILHLNEKLSSGSEKYLTEVQENERPDLVPSSDTSVSTGKGSEKSEQNKGFDGKIAEEESKVNVNPTDAQKEAGNYKKGHIQLGIFDITIEQPRDSIRRGTDADGKEWESKMYYTYGYIKGTEGADGDHIDVFLAHDMENWEEKPVFVVDQYNEDGTFDEHKVMLGFATAEDARTAYLANYEKGWEKKHRIDIGVITLDEFEKWIGSSHRKTKPFAEYKSVKNVNVSLKEQETESGQTTETNSAEQQGGMSDVQQEVFDAVSEMLADAGIEVEVLTNEQMDELAGRSGTTLHARINALHSAAQTIKSWLKNGRRGKVFELNLPQRTIAMIRKAMGRDFDSHNITSNSIVHILKNHGVNGTKLQSNSIPLREEDVELIPYIMTAPDRVEKSSTDGTNRDSVRFYKTLSNGYVVVVEKEYKNSPNDMETITMWAELSSAATNAQSNKTAPDTLVRNAIRSTDAAKIRKDAETAIAEDENIEKRQEKAKEEAIDKEYFAAIERGDMEEVQRLVNQRADEAGYTPESDYQGTSAFNGAAPSSSAYYDTKEERLEALNTDEFEGDVSLGDMIDAPGSYVVGGIEDFAELQLRRGSATARESASAILDAINSGKRKITVYRSIPADIKETKLRNGDWVTLNRDYAKENAYIHGWKGKIIEEEVDIDNLWWDGNDINEWGYDDGKAYAYQNTKNNRKLLDPITYDERGNIIPLSKRFNKRSPLPQLMTVYHGSGADFDAFDHIKFLKDRQGKAYGAAVDGKIYLNGSVLNPETPIHEYTHIWDEACRKHNPELWQRGVELMKQTPLWDEVKNDPNYSDLTTDDEIASEIHARLTGKDGAQTMERMVEESRKNGIIANARSVTLREQLRTWLSDFWYWLKDTMTPWSKAEAEKVSLQDFVNMPVKDLVQGTDLKGGSGMTAEQNRIIERAKADGTYMKAPNGKPSNLSPRQWVQVRTRAFKKWFGNWEKAARIEKLRNSKAVEISGEEITPSEDLKQYKKNALEYGKKLQGIYTNKDTGNEIQLQRGRKNGGINEVLQHNYKDVEHLQSIAAIPQIISESVYIDSEQNRDRGKNPNVVEYQHFVCGLKIGGVDYTVHSAIAVDKSGNRYYDHNLTRIEKTELLDFIDQAAAVEDFGTMPDTKSTILSDYKGKQLISLLQTNSSKFIDENGEPKVFYHNTDNEFTAFNPEKNGTKTDAGWLGDGFYFYGDESEGNGYGKNKMAVFLNVREPYYATSEENNRLAEADDRETSIDFRNEIESEGYDGVYYNGDLRQEAVVFSPTQIKSATDNVGEFDGGSPDIRFQFIGERGAENMDKAEEATTRLDNLGTAREMETAGKDAKTIKMATGWERGADGKWRYETPDGKFDRDGNLHPERYKLSESEQEELDSAFDETMQAFEKGALLYDKEIDADTDMVEIYVAGGMEKGKAQRIMDLENKERKLSRQNKKLDDYLDNEELFKAYPQLRDIEVEEDPNAPLFHFGSYNPETNTIKFNFKSNDVLLHEVQHIIQRIEGFSTGGSPSSIASARHQIRSNRNIIRNLFNDLGFREWYAKQSDTDKAQWANSTQEFAAEYAFAAGNNALIEKLDEGRKLINEALEIIGNEQKSNGLGSTEVYNRLAGEVEARNVERRMDMSMEERRASLAEETEDVAREDQIFIKNALNEARKADDDVMFRESEGSYTTGSGDTIEFTHDGGLLENAEDGEFCLVERAFTENGYFGFTALRSKIKTVQDVAYIFRKLEDKAVENSFAVLVKEGKPTIIHLGMGTQGETLVDASAIRLAYDKFGADKIYFVHNHPSGKLVASRQDVEMIRRIRRMFPDGVVEDGIIIDLNSGKFGTFNEMGSELPQEHKQASGKRESRLNVLTFDRQVFAKDFDISKLQQIRSSEDIAAFLSSQRLGARQKMSVLLLNNQNQIIGNYHLPFAGINDEQLADEIVRLAIASGARNVVPYGNFTLDRAQVRNLKEMISNLTDRNVTLLDCISVDNGLNTMSAADEGMIYEPTEAYRPTRQGESRQRDVERIVKEGGIVTPGLNEMETAVVEADADHGFSNFNEAKSWAKENIARVYDNTETGGKGTIRISNSAIDKYMSQGSVEKSDSKDVHMSVLKVLPEVLKESIDAEQHADYKKDGNGDRSVGNEVNKDVIVHRLYGAVNLDGKIYRVKITVKENIHDVNEPTKAYNYEATKIELLAGQHEKAADNSEPFSRYSNNSISAAKLLKDVEKSYDKGKKLLDESEKADSRAEQLREGEHETPTTAYQQRKQMRQRVEELVERLHLDNVEIVTDTTTLDGKKAKGKGFYNKRTGKITIVLPNNTSLADVEQTLLHEAVAHHGLRQMFGKNLNNFLDSVYENASDDVKRKINKLAINKYGYDFRTATEEYLASLAERTNFEEAKKSGWWKKVKTMFVELLEKVGFAHLKGEKLTDNELRYILWRSYENLKGGKGSGILAEAADIAMQYDLGTGEYADTPKAVNDRFNARLDELIANPEQGQRVLSLGFASDFLQAGGLADAEIKLDYDKVVRKSKESYKNKHPFDIADIHDLSIAVQNPIAVFDNTNDKNRGKVILTELQKDGHNFIVAVQAVEQRRKGGVSLEVNEITTLFPKEARGIINWLNQNKATNIDKVKALHFIEALRNHLGTTITVEELDSATKVVKEFENPSVSEENILFRELADEVNGLKDNAVKTTRKAYVDKGKGIRAANNAAVEVGKEIKKLYKVASLQKEYDINTVKSVYNIINKLIDNKLLDDVSLSELKRILSSIKNATGAKETSRVHTYSNAINQLINLIADNQIRNGREAFKNMLKVKPNPVDAKGVEKLGALDEKGKQTLKKVREYINLPLTKRDANGELQPDCIEYKLNDAAGRMKDANPIIAENAQIEYDALVIARQYANEIAESKTEEKELRDELEAAKLKHDAGQIDYVSYRELRKTLNDAILENKLNRADAYNGMIERTGEVINGSAQRAENWHEQEKRRIEEIHHNANSDMQGRPAAEHTGKDNDKITKIVNNSAFQFLFKSQATFDQMLRLFGNKSVRGEGYLYNRYMRGWLSATEKEYIGNRDALNELNAKASQVFGREMQWSDLFAVDRKLKDVIVSFFNDGEKRETVLTQGNALYIYMANKMIDGKMKLRAMGISELDVEKIKEKLDPRLITLADWLQDEFLPSKRQKYNEVYKRMFGVSMAEIDNYFPLKINQKARTTEVDVAEDNEALGLPSTTTGNIVKRKRNTLALDITNANAFSVILDHIWQMEHWAAFAEWNRDLNTLLSYKHFRNQVLNMKSVYGSGQTLWNNFRDVSRLAAGAYRPKQSDFDQQAVNIAKGVSAAKVNFRLFTAMKQFLSIPAFLSDTDPATLGKNMVHPVDSWTWAMENLPLFEKRWQSRMAGDPRLMKTEMDWKMWQTKVVEISSRIGMSPNAFVDALTVSIGAYSVYESRKRHYKKLGFDEKYSEEHAKQDATIAFNQTQQSSESVFLSTMQVDRTWASVLFSVFRNSSMAYTRQLYDALRNLGRMSKKGYKEQSIEFMKKQFMREGLTEEQAAKAAAKEFRKGLARDTARVAIFGYGIQFLWNLGSYLPYLIFGDDDDEKDKMLSDAAIQAIFGGLEGLVGGDVMSIAGLTLIKSLKGEDVNWQYLTKDMPLSSDIESMLRHLSSDKALAMNDVVNILVQMGVGVNPQTLTDVVAAMIDAFGNDTKAMFEAGLLIGRIINVPQSQLDKIYFDEIDMDGTEAKKMSPKEIVERYAAYKAFREAPFTNWVNKEEREGKKQRQAEKIVKDKFKKTKKFDEFKKGAEKGKAKSDRLNEAIKDGDADKAREIANGLSEDNTYNQYRIMNDYNRYANQITKFWLNSKTAEERQRAAELLIGLQDRIVDEF